MRVIWSSTGQRKELASKETKWNRLVENDPLTLDNFISFNRTYICLINGEVFKISPDGRKEPFLPRDSPLSSLRFSFINASFGTLFLVDEEGHLYACGKSNYGQCGLVTEDDVTQFREVKLVAPLAVCPHGVTVTSHEPISVRLVSASQRLVCVIDVDGRIWSYGDRSLKIDSNGRVEGKPMPFSPSRKALQIDAGCAHFVCLVAYYVEEGKGIDMDAQSIRSNILPSTHCERCREEDELRLSTLMERADRDARKRHGLEGMVECDEETSANLMSAAKNFRLQFKSDSSQSSPRGKTLPAWGRASAAGEDGSAGAIEMTAVGPSIGLELMNLPGGHFTFVSLDSLPLTYMDSTIVDRNVAESCSNTDCTTSSGNSSHRSATSSPRKNGTSGPISGRDDRRAPLEVWTWGANNFGQLGHNDLIARREPFKVSALSGISCVKVSAGDNHTAALTATGELYVWGSNKCGQLKQSDQSFITIPSLFRVGSQSSVLDVSASFSQTAVIVSGIDATPTIYLCGQNPPADFFHPQIFRISSVEKIGFPMCVRLLGTDLVLGVQERSTDAVDESGVAHVFSSVFSRLKFAKFARQLADLCQMIHERSHVVGEPETSNLLNNLTISSCAFAVQVARVAEACRAVLTNKGDSSMSAMLEASHSFSLMDSLCNFHADFVDCIAFGCFADIDLGESLSSYVNKLCLEHEAESMKQYRRLRKLFQKAFDCLQIWRSDAETFLNANSTVTASNSQIAISEWCSRWKTAEQRLNHLGDIADGTFRYWKRPAVSNEQNLKSPSRLVLWSADAGEEQCVVKNVTNVKPKSYLPRSWTSLAVFNDAVALSERREFQLYKFPLVWAEPLQRDNRHFVRIYTPEDELHVEFNEAAAKADFLQVCHEWRTFGRRYARRRHHNTSGGSGLKRRYGEYTFSSAHPSFKNCIYEGSWLCGKPHGRGHLKYPDRKEYKGHFEDGVIEGFGELTVPAEQSSTSVVNSVFFTDTSESSTSARGDVYTGCWHNGQINGLVSVKWANGSTYEGYMRDGLRHGHGVQQYTLGGEQQIYIGGWRMGMRQGYGVASSNRERYLGLWANDMRQGNGVLISIDGAYHEGTFDKDRLMYGRLLCSAPDGEFNTIYEGHFEKAGVICGKGVLQVSKHDLIEGQMNGNLISGEVRLSNAIFKKCVRASSPLTPVGQSLSDEEPSAGRWTVPSEVKWKEMFEHFLMGDLRIDASSLGQQSSYDSLVGVLDHNAIWRSLAGTMTQIRNGVNIEKFSFIFDDRLEKIPSFDAPWSNTYYAMVVDYWRAALSNKFHPLCRLVNGLIEVFTSSYNNIGTHRAVYGELVHEFNSIISRLYAVVRILFTNLPPSSEMHTPVPICVDRVHTSSADSSELSTATASTVSLNSLLGCSRNSSPQRHNVGEMSPSRVSYSSHKSALSDDFSVLTPACDFIVEHLFAQSYAIIFTIYSVSCAEADKRYWDRVVFLNAHTDVKLLTHLEVNRDLWPIDVENANDLDMPMIRATARKKFYKSAIHTLQRLSCEFNPSAKLAILAETFSEISACVTRFAEAGEKHVWTTDDLLPAFMYVTVRAQLQHLGAEIRLIADFAPQLRGGGQIELMFTTLKASYMQICKEKSLP
uniref:Alsin n=1 Tax=Ascaris suum TaxID=6253 RepID=F1KQV4_ASCSU